MYTQSYKYQGLTQTLINCLNEGEDKTICVRMRERIHRRGLDIGTCLFMNRLYEKCVSLCEFVKRRFKLLCPTILLSSGA